MMLRIADDFALPDEAVTETFAILAKRGMGKTHLASVLFEEMVKAGLVAAVLDPTGAWWGVRANASGKGPGLPVAVLGGEHGDLPLTEDMGVAVADLLVAARVPMVIDLSLLYKSAQSRFVAAFAETLYQHNRQALHLFVDEADAFAPQRPQKGEERMLGAMESIVRRGRIRGLGVTLITQRAAVLNKNVLTQIEVLVALRNTAPHDIHAIDEWVKNHDVAGMRDQFLASLPSLERGTAWFWSPGWLEVFRQVQVRQRETFNSSATPKVGEVAARPDVLAEIDLSVLEAALADSIEQAEQTDVKALQHKVEQLQKQLTQKPEPEIRTVEVPVIRDEQLENLKLLAGQMMQQAQELIRCSEDIMQMIRVSRPAAGGLMAVSLNAQAVEEAREQVRRQPVQRKPIRVVVDTQTTVTPLTDTRLGPGALRILAAIARFYPNPLSRNQAAALAGMSVKGGTFTSYLSHLRRAGLMVDAGSDLAATEAGVEYLGDDVPPLPQTTKEMMAMWREVLPGGPYKMLDVLVFHFPNWVSRDFLAESVGMTASGGTFTSYLSKLRKSVLIEEQGRDLRASAALFVMESAR